MVERCLAAVRSPIRTMMAPGDIVPLAFHNGLAGLSFLVAALGSYVALAAAVRIADPIRGKVRAGYVAVAGFAMGGVGIWSMHFIGMQAQILPFTVEYQVVPTIVSFLAAVILSAAAFWYVAAGRFTLGRCMAGGLLAGIGVAAMHYIGMAAMRMPADLHWSPVLVPLSCLVAMVAATVALWLAFNIHSEGQRVLAAMVMAVAVCGMHYTSVAGAVVICSSAVPEPGMRLGGASLPYAVFILSAVALIAIRWQLHRTSEQFRADLAARMDALLETAAPVALRAGSMRRD
jgi:NO-binding membrane sensor protein with MHYT domain